MRFLPSKLKGLVTTATVEYLNLLPLQQPLAPRRFRYRRPCLPSNTMSAPSHKRRAQLHGLLDPPRYDRLRVSAGAQTFGNALPI